MSLTLNVVGANSIFTYDIVANANSRTDMKWQNRTFTFTANSTGALLTFTDNNNSGFGAVIDNVSIAPVPVPAALPLLLAGLGGLALLRRRRTV